jgi:hypothetical protein
MCCDWALPQPPSTAAPPDHAAVSLDAPHKKALLEKNIDLPLKR